MKVTTSKKELKDINIAWIEDDSDVIFAVVKPLINQGVTIKPYYNYAEAIKHIDEIQQCDLILLDVILPPGASNVEGNSLGIKLLRLLRNEYQLKLPIIVFSIVANASDIISPSELELLGAQAVPKGITPQELKAEVVDILGLSG
jgi:CheY-like chemotaxis protein